MKRAVSLAAAIALAATALFAVAARDAGARPSRYYHHQRHHKAHVHSPAGKSSWCKNNPKKCHDRKSGDPKVNTRHESCMDSSGNGDGYISGWEKDHFGGVCR